MDRSDPRFAQGAAVASVTGAAVAGDGAAVAGDGADVVAVIKCQA